MEKYNGWTNYATWRVNLEIFDNWYFVDHGYNIKEAEKDAYDLGLALKEYVEELLEQETGNAMGIAFSYAMAFLADVNWQEIARHVIERESEEA